MRKKFLLIFLLMLVPLSAGAATFKGGEDYNLPKDEVIEGDLYVGAGTVTLDGTVEGDATLAGGNITVTGSVTEDLIVTGGALTLLGDIGDDVKLAGGSISVGGEIGGELVAAGGMVNVLPGANIKEDVTLSGGKLIFNGVTGGDLIVYGEEVEVRGTVMGNIEGEVEKLILADGAVVEGDLSYKAPREAEIDEGATIVGSINYTFSDRFSKKDVKFAFDEFSRYFSAALFSLLFVKYLAFLMLGLVLTLWLTKKTSVIVRRTHENFGRDLLLGFAVTFLTPIALGIMFVTGVGTILAILGFTIAFALTLIATAYAGVFLGVLIRDLFSKKKDTPADWKSALLGQTVLPLVMLVPIIGWAFAGVLVLATYGSLVRIAYDRFWMTR